MSQGILYILIILVVVLLFMLIYVALLKHKKRLHYQFLIIIVELLIYMIAVICCGFYDDSEMFVYIDNFTYLGAAFIPVSLIMLGFAYRKDHSASLGRQWLLFIVPVITMVIIFTNDYHHLFYASYTVEGGYVAGPYFYIYALYSYVCMISGMVMLSYYAIKSSGVLSIQAILIVVGSLLPAVVNVCYTIGVPGFSYSSTPIAFTVTIAMYLLGMMRFNLLKVTPIALQTVIDRISDCFVVVDRSYNVLGYNRAFDDR